MNINDKNIIEITDELSDEFEVAKVLRKYPKDTVIVKNVICQSFQASVIPEKKSQNQSTAKSLKLHRKS